MIEKFLLTCGKVAYTGPEMFATMTQRQQLIDRELKNNRDINITKQIIDDLPIIKVKALLTNLMISRDIIQLNHILKDIQNSADCDIYYKIPEYIESIHIVNEYNTSQINLKAAIISKDIQLLDQTLSFASCHNYYSDDIPIALQILTECSKNPAKLILKPIVEALRNHDISNVHILFEKAYNLG